MIALRGKGKNKVTEVHATQVPENSEITLRYTDTEIIGNGSFGVVFKARLLSTGELVAIKKVIQDKRFRNRELDIMRRLNHCNVVKLKYFFYSHGEKKDDIYLNLVLEYVPETLYGVIQQYNKLHKCTILPMPYVKIYMYQLFRSLAYVHSLGICHRDVKPRNLLLDTRTSVLKLCDFGGAKHLVKGESHIAYICSRYYRAPELTFSATDYTTKIDVWSAGCVVAELMLGRPIFPGETSIDQLVEIIKVLGTPTKEQISEMNKDYAKFKYPQVKARPWQQVFCYRPSPEAIDLLSRVFQYSPSVRITALQACAHTFFDDLRVARKILPNNRELPPLFNFTENELMQQPDLRPILIPPHVRSSASEGSVSNSVPTASATAAAAAAVDNPQSCTLATL